jgi:hypothetical protein
MLSAAVQQGGDAGDGTPSEGVWGTPQLTRTRQVLYKSFYNSSLGTAPFWRYSTLTPLLLFLKTECRS